MARVGPALGAPATERALAAAPLAWLVRNLEAEQERWFLWLPVMFGAGIAVYFLLPVEPWTAAALLPVVAALALHRSVARGAMAALMTGALLATALGIAAGKLRTEAVRAPVLQKQVGPVDVYGFVELVEPRPTKGQRLTVRVTALEKQEPHAWPARVRVRTMTETADLQPGDAVRLKATLSPRAGTGAARRLRFCACGVVPGARRRRLRHGGARAGDERGRGAADFARERRRSSAAASDRPAHRRGPPRPGRRHCQCAHHR